MTDTMHQDRFEALIDLASSKYESERAVIDEARADLAAMHQKITAEALRADGWRRQYQTVDSFWRKLDHHLFIEDGTVKIWTGRVDGAWVSTSAQNMHDLRELVRLLGGRKEESHDS